MKSEVWRYAIRLNPSAGMTSIERMTLIVDVRQARPDLSLAEARALVDNAPSILINDLSQARAEGVRAMFRDRRSVDLVNTDGTPFGPELTKNWPWRC